MADIRIIPSTGLVNVTGSIDFRGTGGSTMLFMTGSTRNLGIGTVIPLYKLDVYGGSAATYIGLRAAGAGNETTLALSNVNGDAYIGLTGGANNIITGTAAGDLNINNRTGGKINLSTTSANPQVTVSSGGNVGIGTTAPGARLEVAGNGIGKILIGDIGGYTNYAGISLNGSAAAGYYNILSRASDGTLLLNRPFGDIAFYENNNTLDFIIKGTSGNVGIGTASPSNKLQIVGGVTATSFTGSLLGNASTATSATSATTATSASFASTAPYSGLTGTVPTWNQNTTGNSASATILQTTRTFTIGSTGKNFNGSADVSWTLGEIGAQAALTNPVTGTGTTNFVTKFTGTSTVGNSSIFDNGNVGIGIINPIAKLHVSGSSGSLAFNVEGSQGQLFSVTDSLSGSLMSVNDISGLPILEVFSDDRVLAGKFGTIGLSVSGSNIGIGAYNPARRLDVYDATAQIVAQFSSSNATSVRIRFSDANTGNENVNIGAVGTRLALFTNNTERFSILSGGNVGIGTTAPSALFEVASSGATFASIKAGSQTEAYLQLVTPSSGIGYIIKNATTGNSALDKSLYLWNSDGPIQFVPSGVIANAVTVAVGGNVGIGTNVPTNKLQVVGGITATSFVGALTGNASTATTASFASTAPYSGLTGTVPTWNQNTTGNAASATVLQTARTIGGVSFNGSANINLPGVNTAGNQNTTGNAATATTASFASTAPYSGLSGTVPTWNQNTTGNAASATVLQNARTIGGVSFNGSANINLPGVNAAGNQNTTGNASTATTASFASTAPYSGLTGTVPTWNQNTTGNAATATDANHVTGTNGQLIRKDDRIIEPNSINAGRLQFGFTSYANNNTAPYGDYLHLRSYTDASGGADNLIMFLKSGIGMRIYQQAFESATAYSTFKDVAFTDSSITGNAASATVLQTARTIGGVSFNGSADINLPGVNAAGNQNTTGNASTATTASFASTAPYSGLTGTVPTWNQNTTGNAGSVTNGVYTTGAQTIDGIKTFSELVATNPMVNSAGTSNDNSVMQWRYGTSDAYRLRLKQTVTSGVVRWNFSQTNNNSDFNDVLVLDRGNVGIGVTSPAFKLDVTGQGRFTSTVTATKGLFSDSSGQAAVLEVFNTVATNATTAIIRQTTAGGNGNQDIGLLVDIQGAGDSDRIANFRYFDGTTNFSRMAITRGGNVGIGLTAPGQRLQVEGSLLVNPGTSSTAFRDIMMGGIGGWSTGESHGIDTVFSTAASPTTFSRIESHFDGTNGRIRFRNLFNASAARTDILMTIAGSGNVGIGTDSPAFKLDVSGTGRFTDVLTFAGDTRYGVSRVYNASIGDMFGLEQVSSVQTGTGAATRIFADDSANNYISLGSYTNATTFVDHLRIITSTGNVGIGITNPSAKFYVNNSGGTGNPFYVDLGNPGGATTLFEHTGASTPVPFRVRKSGFAGASPNYGLLYLHMNDSTISNGSNLYFTLNDSAGNEHEYAGLGGTIRSNTNGAETGDLFFMTSDAGTTRSEKMRIISNGNVGIGTSAPGALLEIVGPSSTFASINAKGGDNAYLQLVTPSSGIGYIIKNLATANSLINKSLYLWNSDGPIQFVPSGVAANAVTVAVGGNVGIGTNAPTAPLAIRGGEGTYDAPNFGSTNLGAIHILNVTSARRNAITFSSAGSVDAQAGIYVHQDNSAGTHMYFATTDNYGTGPQTRLTIRNAGNVGIGTTTPSVKLHVNGGGIRIQGSGDPNNSLRFDDTGGTSRNAMFISSSNYLVVGNTNYAGIQLIHTGSAPGSNNIDNGASRYYGTDQTYYLAEPNKWLAVRINSVNYVMPLYQV